MFFLNYETGIISPEHPITQKIIEMIDTPQFVQIIVPKIKEEYIIYDIKKIAKKLRFYFNGKEWKRCIDYTTGTEYDRTAEAAHTFLKNQYIVKLHNKIIMEMAVAGIYEKEHTRWIFFRKSGRFTGWFAINWYERNKILYESARRLTKSEWSRPDVVVPPDQFNEVIGFSQIHSFRFTPSAQFLCKYGMLKLYTELKSKPITSIDFTSKIVNKELSTLDPFKYQDYEEENLKDTTL